MTVTHPASRHRAHHTPGDHNPNGLGSAAAGPSQPAPSGRATAATVTAYAAASAAFSHALVSAYWALGGHGLISTAGGYAAQVAHQKEATPVLLALAAAVAKAAGGLPALALARPWGRVIPRAWLRAVSAAASVLLIGYGGLNVRLPCPVQCSAPRGAQSSIPLWVGGNSAAAIGRSIKFGAAWHPLRVTLPFAGCGDQPYADRARATHRAAAGQLTGRRHWAPCRQRLGEVRRLSADTVVLDPYHSDPEKTRRPDLAWRALTTVATRWRTAS